MPFYSELEVALGRMLRTHLEARLALCEMRRVSLNAEIDALDVTRDRRARAVLERDQVMVEWGTVMTELRELDESDLSPSESVIRHI